MQMLAEVKKTSRGLLSSAALQTFIPTGMLASRKKLTPLTLLFRSEYYLFVP